MEIMFEDINLVNLPSYEGGEQGGEDERLSDFLRHTEAKTLAEVNSELVACGIEPITTDQIIITGIRGE